MSSWFDSLFQWLLIVFEFSESWLLFLFQCNKGGAMIDEGFPWFSIVCRGLDLPNPRCDEESVSLRWD